MTIEEKIKLQARALRNTAFIPLDKTNVENSMPLLLPHQVENVYKAEYRFLNPPGTVACGDNTIDGVNKGFLFTDGTGTGKTYTGLGIIKRAELRGITDVLVVVPTDAKVKDWQIEAKFFHLYLYQLKDMKDAGGIGTMVITTYANFRGNKALLMRAAKKPFGLVIYDESHKIVSNEGGDSTDVDMTHKIITNSPTQSWLKALQKYKPYIDRDMLSRRMLTPQTEALVKAEQQRLIDSTKVVFLSATPFSYHKNLTYADGYLFTIKEGIIEGAMDAYNYFFCHHFGYRIRVGRLCVPDAEIDQGMLERQFHTKLTRAGAISSTRLKLEKDYSREFVLVDDAIGNLIDEGYKIASDKNTYKYLPDLVKLKFTGHYEAQLLEALKARKVIPRIQEHLSLGRKVVIFHTYNHSFPSHPFDFSDTKLWPADVAWPKVQAEIQAFNTKYPQFAKLDMSGLKNPIDTIRDAFGDKVVMFNGTVSAKERTIIKRKFNDDNSGVDIILVQMEAGKEGISLHDISGIHQRGLLCLGLPIKPTDSIQLEGRIYRIGQMSDAVIEYPVLHLNFEKIAFATKINERAKTAENLAFGEQARNLKDAFKEGYKTPTIDPPSLTQGTGSRDADFVFDAIDPWTMAIKLYINRGKRSAKTKEREGKDYFATPEPIGLKMVEWLYSKPNDNLLEPSAGHGAIGRFFPENTNRKYIEPSYDLRADLAINTSGQVIHGYFEDHHIINKYDGIAMNPPFGTNSKTAMEHLVKALGHLSNGGRVIAIVPDGPSMESRLENYWKSEDSEGRVLTGRIKLPSVTFERAGTVVNTQLLIIDFHMNQDVLKRLPSLKEYNFRHIEDINQLFKELKDLEMPKRLKAEASFKSQFVGGRVSKAVMVTGKHTKLKYPIWTVKLVFTPSAQEFETINIRCRKLGGWYSDYAQNKAVPGFIFKVPEPANELLAFINS